MNLTVRNIPNEIIEKIRALSKIERRSLNNEVLITLERGLNNRMDEFSGLKKSMPKDVQISLWRDLLGMWEDDRSTEEIVEDIYSGRTLGRKVVL